MLWPKVIVENIIFVKKVNELLLVATTSKTLVLILLLDQLLRSRLEIKVIVFDQSLFVQVWAKWLSDDWTIIVRVDIDQATVGTKRREQRNYSSRRFCFRSWPATGINLIGIADRCFIAWACFFNFDPDLLNFTFYCLIDLPISEIIVILQLLFISITIFRSESELWCFRRPLSSLAKERLQELQHLILVNQRSFALEQKEIGSSTVNRLAIPFQTSKSKISFFSCLVWATLRHRCSCSILGHGCWPDVSLQNQMWERRVPIVLRKLRIIKPDERLRSQLSERAQRIGSLIFRMHINQTKNYHQSLLEQRQDDAYRFAVLFDDGIKGEVVYDELPLDEGSVSAYAEAYSASRWCATAVEWVLLEHAGLLHSFCSWRDWSFSAVYQLAQAGVPWTFQALSGEGLEGWWSPSACRHLHLMTIPLQSPRLPCSLIVLVPYSRFLCLGLVWTSSLPQHFLRVFQRPTLWSLHVLLGTPILP